MSLTTILARFFLSLLAAVLPLSAAAVKLVPVGVVSFDSTGFSNVWTIDIADQTGPNSTVFPDPTFPVATTVGLSDLNLTLNFANGNIESFDASYFWLAPDGISLDGAPFSTNVPVVDAVLVGDFSYSSSDWNLNDGSSFVPFGGFRAIITDPSGTLSDGHFAVINAANGPIIPEPKTLFLLGVGLVVLLFRCRRKTFLSRLRGVLLPIVSLFFVCDLEAAAFASVKLNTFTSPTSGVSGKSLIWVFGSGFPSGTINPSNVHLSFQENCGESAKQVVAMGIRVVPVLGTSDKLEFQVPESLSAGTYFVSLTGSTVEGVTFASSNCSEINVAQPSLVGSWNPGSALGLLVPSASGAAKIVAYVPNAFLGGGSTGVRVVPIEGGGSPTAVSTGNHRVNACSVDSALSEAVCTSEDGAIELIKGTTLAGTLEVSSDTYSLEGCVACGVAVNPNTHQAALSIVLESTAVGGTGALQFLDIASATLGTVVPTRSYISTQMQWDPFRDLLLSPSVTYTSAYTLYQISSGDKLPSPATVEEILGEGSLGFGNSAAEDVETGIALSPANVDGILLVDLTERTQTGGSWSAPFQFYGAPELTFQGNGAAGMAITPGGAHLGVVTSAGPGFGQVPSHALSVLLLPPRAGIGIPNLVDYALAEMPKTPDGLDFEADRSQNHTTNAYTSPNSGKAYAVVADWASGTPAYLALVDLHALLAAPRFGLHTVDPNYNLIAHGVVRYVATR